MRKSKGKLEYLTKAANKAISINGRQEYQRKVQERHIVTKILGLNIALVQFESAPVTPIVHVVEALMEVKFLGHLFENLPQLLDLLHHLLSYLVIVA